MINETKKPNKKKKSSNSILKSRPIYEDNHLLVWFKPSGLASQPGQGIQRSLDVEMKEYLKNKHSKPGNVYLGLVHRLDRPTAGLVVAGKTSKAASRLSDQFRKNLVKKRYWAMVEGGLQKKKAKLHSRLDHGRDGRRNKQVEARLSFNKLPIPTPYPLLEVTLETGRKHQIRKQLSELGHPVVGDRMYGSRVRFRKNSIALVAKSIKFKHPTLNQWMSFEVPEEKCLEYFLSI